MKTYRLKIRPQSSFLTPWQADTIFGNICWIIALQEGVDALQNFLQHYKENDPLFVLSDGLPGDLFPAPVHLSLAASKVESLDDYREAKKLKRISWVTPDTFESIRNGNLNNHIEGGLQTYTTFTTLHSTVNRMTGTTGDEGSLFELEEYTFHTETQESDTISIYLKIKSGYEAKVLAFFEDLAKTGYGKKKSVGKGAFDIEGQLEPFDKFDNFDGANGFVSFSNFIPSKTDPVNGFYKTFVKYGKLGGEYTFCGNPFKKPLMMLTTGSTFHVNGDINQFYGRMIENVSPAKPEVVHYGYAFAVPIKLNSRIEAI